MHLPNAWMQHRCCFAPVLEAAPDKHQMKKEQAPEIVLQCSEEQAWGSSPWCVCAPLGRGRCFGFGFMLQRKCLLSWFRYGLIETSSLHHAQKELQCAYGTCMVFVRSARTNYHSFPRICFYISLLTLFQSNCFFLVERTTLDSFIVVADELKKNHVYFCFLLALTRWEVSLVSSVSTDAWVCLFSLSSMATSVVCSVPFICVKHYLVHFVK